LFSIFGVCFRHNTPHTRSDRCKTGPYDVRVSDVCVSSVSTRADAFALSKIEGISYSVGKVRVGFMGMTPTAEEWKPV
jgi:uncharacterized protein (DUF2237 family)